MSRFLTARWCGEGLVPLNTSSPAPPPHCWRINCISALMGVCPFVYLFKCICVRPRFQFRFKQYNLGVLG